MVVERRLVARCNGEWCQQGFRSLPGACRTISGLRSNAQDSERSGELAAERRWDRTGAVHRAGSWSEKQTDRHTKSHYYLLSIPLFAALAEFVPSYPALSLGS